jgi:hypothetical protein
MAWRKEMFFLEKNDLILKYENEASGCLESE